MDVVFFLLGSLPLITALIGFIVFDSPVQTQVAGVIKYENVIEKSEIPSPTTSNSPTPTVNKDENILREENIETLKDLIKEQEYKEKAVEPRKQSNPNENNSGTKDLLTQINNFRSQKGLNPLSANSQTCFFASIRVQEISTAFNHDGFSQRNESNTLPYPSYSQIAENIAMNSDPNAVVPSWINSPPHNEVLSKNVPFGCVVGSSTYYVFEAWAP